jgi:hypothetical protein
MAVMIVSSTRRADWPNTITLGLPTPTPVTFRLGIQSAFVLSERDMFWNSQATAICARLAAFWDDELAGGRSSMVDSNTTHKANREGVVPVLDLVNVSVRVPAKT